MVFFGNRAHGAANVYDPLQLSPIAAYRAVDADVDDSGGNVSVWRDRGAFDCHLGLGSSPTWSATGWNGTSGAVTFTAAPWLIANAGTAIITLPNGVNQPFTVLARLQFTTTTDQVICAWDHTSGAAQSIIRIDNAGTGRMRYQRTDDAGATVGVTSGQDIGTGRVSMAFVFSGSRCQLFLNGAMNIDAPLASAAACTFNRFRVGTGPGAIDAFNGKLKDLTILNYAASAAQAQQYAAQMATQFP